MCTRTLWEDKGGVLAGTEGAAGIAAAPNQQGELPDKNKEHELKQHLAP